MHYITDYQLDINKGFMCKVNGKTFKCEFLSTVVLGKHFYVSNILKVADAMGIARHEFIGIFNSEHVNHVIYCDSKQQCYDLCQIIVKTYFKPANVEKDIISFRCGNESHKFELELLLGKYVWKNTTDSLKHIVNKSQVNLTKLREDLNIKIYEMPNFSYLGFDSREDALKFAKWVQENFYDKKEWCEKSRRHLLKYYNDKRVSICNHTFILTNISSDLYWQLNEMGSSSLLYTQFSLTDLDVEEICKSLNIHMTWYQMILAFSSVQDAMKFTDYLIETYIIKKEKTYDTNQLRKERTAISRGAKPAGGIIHGRRSKASVRCGCIEHKACLGS